MHDTPSLSQASLQSMTPIPKVVRGNIEKLLGNGNISYEISGLRDVLNSYKSRIKPLLYTVCIKLFV
jgi:hypothetical protein